MKKCSYCGQSADDGAAFCVSCGASFKQAGAAQQPQQQQQQQQQQQWHQGGLGQGQQYSGQNAQQYSQPQYYSAAGQRQANGYVGKRRKGLNVVLLTIVTCGIYMLWWYYQCMEDVNNASGEKRMNSMALLLGSIFCSPVILYMLYKMDKNIARLSQENGTEYKENFILWILMTLLCGIGSIIAAFQICDALNAIWDAREGVQRPSGY